jgi:sulfite exporter TauE/SafE
VDATPLAGLLFGFVGSTHCLAMCGGIATAMDRVTPIGAARRAGHHALYAAGRVTSYALLGALAGLAGVVASEALGIGNAPHLQLGARVVTGLGLILCALALSGLRPFAGIERLGMRAWQRLKPLSRRAMALHGAARALSVGVLWGFLPCGMVYAATALAAVAGSPQQGALFMACFGIGTAPAVFGVGVSAGRISGLLDRGRTRGLAAVTLGLCGLWTLLGPILMTATTQGHQHH